MFFCTCLKFWELVAAARSARIEALAFAPRSMADLMSSFFNSDFGCVSVRTKVSDPHAYGAHAPRCPPLLGQRPRLCLLSTGTNDYEEEVGALLPGQVRDPRASLWRADCDPAYLEPVDQAGLRVQQKPKVRHYPLASLSSRMQRSRAPRPPPSTPPRPSTYVHAGVRSHSGRLRLGPWPRPRQRQPRHYFEAGRARRRLRPDCRRRSHRECGRRASWRPPVGAGAAAR